MHKAIERAMAKRDAAEATLQNIKKKIQARCKHEHVAETEGYDSILGYRHARRICMDCGYEEVAWNWNEWSTAIGNLGGDTPDCKPVVLRNDFIKQVSRDEFYKLRIG